MMIDVPYRLGKAYQAMSLCSIALAISACSSEPKYQNTQPQLDLKTFFDGQLVAHGMLQDRSGLVTRRFSADILAAWNGEDGVLDERFVFDDGEITYRCWRLKQQGNDVTGTAGDVVGEARGQLSGFNLHWQYDLRVPYQDSEIVVHLDDQLFLLNQDRLINRTKMSKWGVHLGDISLMIERQGSQATRDFSENCPPP